MAHFAEINSENNEVLRVLVISNIDVENNGGEYSTQAEQWVAANHPQDATIKEKFLGNYPNTYWKQTSYNTYYGKYYTSNMELHENQLKAFRKNYAGVGHTYDLQRDAFIPPKLFNSWILDENTCNWKSPIPFPQDGNQYRWNETILNWELVN
jgi:hypothetical protein